MSTDKLSATFSALADPTRRAILGRLALGQASVGELARPFDMSLRAVSKHLRVLEDAGLLTSGRDAQRRPRKLQAAGLKSAAQWLEQYRRFWEARFDELDELVDELSKKEKSHDGKRKRK